MAKFVSRRAAYRQITPPSQVGCLNAVHIVAPIFHGSNSSSPMPSASDLVFWPDAVRRIRSKMRFPLSLDGLLAVDDSAAIDVHVVSHAFVEGAIRRKLE